MHLQGKTALITGASRGIGEATARLFAKQGANVVLTARSADAIDAIAADIRKAGGKAIAVACDVADYAQLEQVVAATLAEFTTLDILVNNAGVIEPISTLANSDPAAWAQAFNINAVGAYHAIRAVLPVIAQGGTIVNISSGAATSALEGWSHYCASKAAAKMLTAAVQVEEGHRLTCVGLSPGTVATQMQRDISASGINPVSKIDWADHVPPEWPAAAIAWLCGPEGAQYAGDDVSLRDPEVRKKSGLTD